MNEMSAARWMVSRSDIGFDSDLLGSGHWWFGGERPQHRRQLAVDVARDAPALIDERGIEVDAGGPRAQHRHDIGGAADAAVALDGDASARKPRRPRDILDCRVEDGPTVQRALLHAEARLGHWTAAAHLETLDAGLDATLGHLCEAIGV